MRKYTPILAMVLAVSTAACENSQLSGNQPANPAPGAVEARFTMANGCFAIQDLASQRFVVADEAGVISVQPDNAAEPSGFFMKPSALGVYMFYDRAGRWLSNAVMLGEAGGAVGDGAGDAGATIGGVGSLLDIVNPLTPVGGAIGDGGDGVGDAGGEAGDAAAGPRSLQMTDAPEVGSEWVVDASGDGFSIVSQPTDEALAIDGEVASWRFVARGDCLEYPEAQLNASGTPFSGTNPDGTVFGYAETHMHLGGSEALGGRIGYGRPFHPWGIVEALNNCSVDHGPDGSLGALDVAVDPDRTVPAHDVVGWPTFNDWPTHGSQIHHQTYYMWLKRAWMGGLRFMVNHLVANEMLCNVWPEKEHDCNEMESARIQLDLVLGLQDYIDAQEGGPGQGFFRIVTSAAQARAVVEAGKMAVINGTEMEKVFDCGEYLDSPECSEAQIDERLDEWHAMGLRAVFPIHIFDNAFGGSEIARFTNDAALIQVYNGGNIVETGHPYATVPCSQAEAQEIADSQPEDRDIFGLLLLQAMGAPPSPFSGCVNNARPLTTRGEYFINRLIDYGILIESDHSGPLARKRMINVALARNVPIISGHTGSITVSRDSKNILSTGGIISNLSDDPAPVTIQFIQDLRDAYVELFGSTEGLATGFGSDINGIHKQSSPRDDAAENPLAYPFRSYDGQVLFQRQVTGERIFDLNVDGVAHYGLYPDYIADIQRTEGGEEALRYLFRSAEAYIRAMERAEAARRR